MKYCNEIILKINDQVFPAGDPYIMRYNGCYYLYPSTEFPRKDINCFISDNLVDWTFAGTVVEEDLTLNAYAPEVIYANEKFYLCTSPSGNGHYIYEANSPLGPFKRITENINNMIDGSFFLDNDEKLYFSRADHKGIAICEMSSEGKLYNRVDLNAELHGWTEGSMIIYNNGYYYLTYCGNNLFSRGYRIEYGTSRSLLGDYRRGQTNPLLISTHDEFNSLGHSSTVLAPDLDGYYIVYHNHLQIDQPNRKYTRKLNLDRLYFNGRMMTTEATYYDVNAPLLPDFHARINLDVSEFIIESDMILSKQVTKDAYTVEFNFKNRNDLKILFDYQDGCNYLVIEPRENIISLSQVVNGVKTMLGQNNTQINFNNLHTIRVKVKDKIEIYLDQMLKIKHEIHSNGGRIGYANHHIEDLEYIAFTNHAYNDSDRYIAKNLPSILGSTQCLEYHPLSLDPIDEIYVSTLNEGEKASYKITSHKQLTYAVSLFCLNHTKATIEVTNGPVTQIIELEANDNPYAYSSRYLTMITVDGPDEIEIKVIKGSLSYKFIDIHALEIPLKDIQLGFEYKNQSYVAKSGETNVILNKSKGHIKEISVDFTLLDDNVGTHSAGILLNVTNFSHYLGQSQHPYNGYFISVNEGLLMIDKASYGLSRMYDKPTEIGVNQPHQLKVIKDDTKLEVYIDGNLIFHCYDQYTSHFGMNGLYASEIGNVVFSNYTVIYR